MSWISVKDELPQRDHSVYIIRNGLPSIGRHRLIAGGEPLFHDYMEGDQTKDVTHWMPIPKIPIEPSYAHSQFNKLTHLKNNSMINEELAPVYSAECDTCGKQFEHSFEGWSIFLNRESITDRMPDQDWHIGDGEQGEEGKVYCPECYHGILLNGLPEGYY